MMQGEGEWWWPTSSCRLRERFSGDAHRTFILGHKKIQSPNENLKDRKCNKKCMTHGETSCSAKSFDEEEAQERVGSLVFAAQEHPSCQCERIAQDQ
jgi:hypothetical protein